MGELNLELLQRVRDAIADEGNAFDMDDWGVGEGARTWWPAEYDEDQAEVRIGDCGTPACIAGWAVRLSLSRRRSRPPAGWEETTSPGSRASALLGIDTIESPPLFHHDEWPSFAQDLPERQGALALLDALIAGQDPWSDDYVVTSFESGLSSAIDQLKSEGGG